MVQRAEEKSKFRWVRASVLILLPIAPAACQSSPPSELASGLAEPAVVTASANPGGADAPDVSPVPRPVEQHKPAKPRELAFAASRRPKAAVEVQELRAPKQAAEADVSSTVAPQPRATAVPENPAPAPKPESAISNKSATAFEWPVEGKIIQPFGANEGGQRNDGINISADAGTPIHAAANGTVTYASNLKGYGNLVLIKHHNGYITAYAHAEKLLVTAGDRVDRGDVIGYAGKSGGVGSPQLHFEIRKGTTPVDPRPLMTAGRES